MWSKKGFKDAGIIIGVLALILFGIIIYSTAKPTNETSNGVTAVGDLDEYAAELFSATPGIIEQVGEINSTKLEIDFDLFEISGVPNEQTNRLVDTDEIISIEQSAFSGNNWLHTFVANSEVVEATLIFDVEDIAGTGDVKVYLNNKKIHSQQVENGKVVRVSLPLANLNIGALENETSENNVEITVSKPSWILFWKTNSLKLKDIILEQKIFGSDTSKKEFILEFEPDDIVGLDSANLEARVQLADGAESKKLSIIFKDSILYDSVPSSKETLDVSVPISLFEGGDNLLSFETELNSGYSINSELKYTVLDMAESAYKNYKITAGENIWHYIEDGKTDKNYECMLFLKKASGDDAIKVWINNHRMEYSFVGGKIDVNVCDYLEQGENTVKLVANDFVRVDSVRLRIEEK